MSDRTVDGGGSCKVNIKRFHPQKNPSYFVQSFDVPVQEKSTVLQALLYIYENIDPTLSFSFSCRYEKCGLCALMINGKASLACVSTLQEGQEITHLDNLSPVKDLVVSRAPLEELIQREKIFSVQEPPVIPSQASQGSICEEGIKKDGGGEVGTGINFPVLELDPYLDKLLGCTECLCCHASCPVLKVEGLEQFAGPYIFVKLAQLYLDPRDTLDRAAQAKRLGIEKCRSCGKCFCPQGIDIYEKAISLLM